MIARALSIAATVSYTANAALGIGVATGRIDTGGRTWIHHAMYVVTTALTASAVAVALLTGRRRHAAVQAGALVPLGLIPYMGTRTWRHPATASAAAPFYAATLVISRQE